jgi:hypothetical protein
MTKKQLARIYWGAVITGGIILGGLIANAFLSNPDKELLPTYALAELYVSILAFAAVWITLIILIFQLRQSMAKPLIKVAFNKEGEQRATLIYRKDGRRENALPSTIWLINEGNAVARYFQIDFIIPENIGKQSRLIDNITRDDGNYVVSNINDGGYTLFVNRPRPDPNMNFSPAIDIKKCIKVNSFEIEYRVYGDWAETQKGELKVNINRQ